jgi:hypothetical protein
VSDSDSGLWTEDPTETVIGEIMRERVRQVVAEHHLPHQDDRLDMGELARAAASHALRGVADMISAGNPLHATYAHRAALLWPFGRDGLKWHEPRRRLVIAGALIVAEIERLDRLDRAAPRGAGDEDDGA